MRVQALLSALVVSLLGALAGCETPKPPPPLEYALNSPYPGVKTLAVAPVVNQSGSKDFDALTVSDTLFAELQQVNGLSVLPVNKTLAAMRQMGLRSIDSPQTAQKLAAAMGADGIVLAAITAYDPFTPPTVGMTVHLYTVRDPSEVAARPVEARRIDGTPVSTSPASQPVAAGRAHDPLSEGTPDAPGANGPVHRHLAASISAVFNASNQTVRQELFDFARGRTDYDSALKEERFLVDADAYMRFVCHAMVRRLMEVERGRLADR